MSATARMDWAKDLPFDVKVVGKDVESLDEVEWLFWVGCAGAYEDRAKKTTRAVAELLDMAGVDFAVLGNGETCNGDSARRAGNEFVFQGLAQQNIETFKEYKVKKVVSTCAHCFNTLKNEYRDLGYEMEVVHHTQLLNRLVREKKLTPVASNGTSDKRAITYHDPCYIGRHNGVYAPPRELLNVIPDAELKEMPRNSERSFCCGAGGARMWMEETIGSRINETRTAEAVATGADQIAVGCPFCRVMLSDGLTSQQANGEAREEVEVLDVAQLLLASVKGESKPASKSAAAKSAQGRGEERRRGPGGGTAVLTKEADSKAGSEATKAEPEAGDATQTEETVTKTEDVGAAAKASSGGGSLFDIGGDSDDSADDSADAQQARRRRRTRTTAPRRPPPRSPRARRRPRTSPRTSPATRASVAVPCSTWAVTTPPRARSPRPSRRSRRPAARSTAARTTPTPTSPPRARPRPTKSRTRPRPRTLPQQAAPPPRPAPRSPRAARCSTSPNPRSPHPPPSPSPRRRKATGEDPAGDSTTDADVDRSQDDADADVTPRARPRPKPKTETEEAPASGGATSTPGTEIPEGGSLFDIAEPEESAPAAKSEPAAEETADEEDPAGDSTTDADVDRSQDDADADVAPEGETEAEPEARPRPRTRQEAKEAPASGGATSTPGTEIPEGGSLFDIAEPEESAPAAKSEPAPGGQADRRGPGRRLHHRRRRRPQQGRRRRRRGTGERDEEQTSSSTDTAPTRLGRRALGRRPADVPARHQGQVRRRQCLDRRLTRLDGRQRPRTRGQRTSPRTPTSPTTPSPTTTRGRRARGPEAEAGLVGRDAPAADGRRDRRGRFAVRPLSRVVAGDPGHLR